ncbi:hypothetical protein [Methylopila sp. 73B]|uniref:hypothetical protein n=1 Tax=Methylopila sp. 73B TaxID=1120792 RepID=UPI00037BCEB4|nr:hypothetical protein [Methylopila sp. 73B]
MSKDKNTEDLQPTPTQAENDAAKLGVVGEVKPVDEKSDDKDDEKSREAKPAASTGSGYQTRTTGKA